MLLRVAVAASLFAFGVAVGGWAASLDGPSTSLADAQAAVQGAFPDAGAVRDADLVPGYAADPPGSNIWTDAYDGYDYQGFEFPVSTSPHDGVRADQMTQARARLEAAGWRTWALGADGGFVASREGLGLAARPESNSRTIVSVGAINPRVWPAAIVTGLVLAVAAWLLVPLAFRAQRAPTVVAVTSLVLMLPAALVTLLGAVTVAFNPGLPWPAPWGLFLVGNPPLSLLAAFLLSGAVAAGLVSRARTAPAAGAGQPSAVSAKD